MPVHRSGKRIIRALIMDFDGLVLDTEGPAFQAWHEIFEAYGCALPLSVWASGVGGSPEMFDPCGYLEAQLGRKVNCEQIRAEERQREAELIEAQAVLAGVEEYLADARRLGLRLGLASSSDSEWVFGHLSRLGLRDYFDCVRCADDVKKVKPDPELYLSVLQALGVGADEAVVLEDSPNGISAAKAAGVFCVVVPNPVTRQLSTEHADLRLDSLAGLKLEELLLEVEKAQLR